MFYEALNPESKLAKLMFKIKIVVMIIFGTFLTILNGYITYQDIDNPFIDISTEIPHYYIISTLIELLITILGLFFFYFVYTN